MLLLYITNYYIHVVLYIAIYVILRVFYILDLLFYYFILLSFCVAKEYFVDFNRNIHCCRIIFFCL